MSIALFLLPAFALDVRVEHLGLGVTYTLEPGESITDTWSETVLPGQLLERRRRDRRHAGRASA